jgi:hypothetical protein
VGISPASLKRTDVRKISTVEIFPLMRYNGVCAVFAERRALRQPCFFGGLGEGKSMRCFDIFL